ncbi:LOW QUALITY PROTEIN: uncharacterized protein LOC132786379 [Drosophila nasuta]|uniref:LOW QUALITY PROTEIN: uncharacterized protein LOC132786379 n=1 Tax=Drosophila nasuta TaxID=42062 RepID=UPI00295E2635|nr:LOW QUALITY PROTEIN: uncharacterized protein LOC132786379 [Drosophila nasuta]
METELSEEQLAIIVNQVQLCMLPALKENLDEVQLLPEHLKTYHLLLRQELPRLFDLIHKHEDIFTNKAFYKELRQLLVLLLCELSASSTIYKLDVDATNLLQTVDRLLKKLETCCQLGEEAAIFTYYEQKLHKDCWKRELGAVHGYERYLEHCCANEVKMTKKLLTFSLAVGLNVRECHLPEYKHLGVRIFARMLSSGDASDIQELNVQGVIYENLFRDAYTMDAVDVTTSVWKCLCQCLDHFTMLDSYTWNQCDDMLERLIHNVTMASRPEMSISLLEFITQLGYYFTINRAEVKEVLSSDFSQPEQLAACREVCASINVCTNYRWAKAILQMLVLESEKLLRSVSVCTKLLLAMQRCYLVCIFPIPLQALNVHLREFLTKFVAVLLECIVVHEKAKPIVQLTQEFIEIFICQLNNSTTGLQTPSNLKEFATALDSLQQLIVK